MRVVLNVYVESLKNDINRRIEVSSSIKLDDLCEYIIVSLNGQKTYSYFLEDDYYIDGEKVSLSNLMLSDLDVDKKSKFALCYDLDSFYCINIEIVDILEEDDNRDIFKVIDGKGYGILDGSKWMLFNYFNHSIKNRKNL